MNHLSSGMVPSIPSGETYFNYKGKIVKYMRLVNQIKGSKVNHNFQLDTLLVLLLGEGDIKNLKL